MVMNDLELVQKAQDTLNQIRNQRIDHQQMQISNMWANNTTGAGFMDLTVKPGSIVKWQRYQTMTFSPIEIDDETYKKEKEDAALRHVKIFLHIAKAFVERFPNWEIMPDPADPFKRVVIIHKNKQYKIEDSYPDGTVKLWGARSDSKIKAERFAKRHGIPPTVFKHTAPPTTPTETFYGWALGMEDVPD